VQAGQVCKTRREGTYHTLAWNAEKKTPSLYSRPHAHYSEAAYVQAYFKATANGCCIVGMCSEVSILARPQKQKSKIPTCDRVTDPDILFYLFFFVRRVYHLG
jgi:hypothetical protein